jgi:hypothetical protein
MGHTQYTRWATLSTQDGPHSVYKKFELLSQRLSEEDVQHFKVTGDREKTLGLWTMKKERRKYNLMTANNC